MATGFFPEDVTEDDLATLATAYEGLAANATQLSTVTGPLVNAIAGGISANDAALTKVNGTLKSAVTRGTNQNAAQLATVTQPLQTAVAAQAGEISAQTAIVAQQAAAAQPPSTYTPPPETSSGGGSQSPTAGSVLPISGYLNADLTGNPIQDAMLMNEDTKQEAFNVSNGMAILPAGKPIGKFLYLVQQPGGGGVFGGIAAARPLKKGLQPPGAGVPKTLTVQINPNIPGALFTIPPGGIQAGFLTDWQTATTTGMVGGGGGGGGLPGGGLPVVTPSPPTLPVLPIGKPLPPGGGGPVPIGKPIGGGGQQPQPQPGGGGGTPIGKPIGGGGGGTTPTTPQPGGGGGTTPTMPKGGGGGGTTPTMPKGGNGGGTVPTLPRRPGGGGTTPTMPKGGGGGGGFPIPTGGGGGGGGFPIPTGGGGGGGGGFPIPTGGGGGGGGVHPTLPVGGGGGGGGVLPVLPIGGGGGGFPLPTGGGGGVFPTLPRRGGGGGGFPLPTGQGGGFPFPTGGGFPGGQFPGGGTVNQPLPITTTTTNPITGQTTTVVFTPTPGGGVSVNVQPCCTLPPPDEPGTLPQPPSEPVPRVRVLGAGDERPDDVEEMRCSVKGGKFFMPVPGSEQWCKLQSEIVKGLSDLGKQVLDWLKDIVHWLHNKEAQDAALPDPKFSSPLSIVSDLWTLLIRAIGRVAAPMLEKLWGYLCSLQRGMLQVGRCDTDAYIGCAVIACVIKLLKRTRLGSDAGVWATVDAVLDFPSVETAIAYVMNSICPVNIPGPGDAMEAYLRGWLSEERYHCWLNAHGYNEQNMSYVLRARREKLSTDDIIQWGRRHKINDDTITGWLKLYGWMEEQERAAAVELYDELPTISDHLHWLQRNVFDDAYVKDYNLMEGFEDRFWAKFGDDLRALGMKKEYAELHYAAHWINPSPGQLFEMLRRLRPGRVDKSVQFTEQDLLRLLAEQDIAPYFRERFRQIAYVPFGLRFMRQLYDTRQIDDAEASQRFQDLGYKPTDADMLVKSESIRRARTVATQTQGFTASNIRKLYVAGKMKNPEAIRRLGELGYPEKPANDAIDAWVRLREVKAVDDGSKAAKSALVTSAKDAVQLGVITEAQAQQTLVRAGFSNDNAASLVSSWVTMDRIRITKLGISYIKKAVMSGMLALNDVQTMLAGLGLTPEKVNEYINSWTYDLTASKRHIAASEINRLLTEGLIDVATARVRLANLNYADPDAQLLIAEAAYRINQNEQKAAAAELRSREQQAKQLIKAIDANKKQLARMQKQLTGLGTVKTLTMWYRNGLIGPAYLTSRLLAMGYQQVDIDLLIEEANIEGKPKQGTTPVTPVNQGVRSTGSTPGSPGG